MIQLPRLYAIVDSAHFPATSALCAYVEELVAGGVTLLQYRNKSGQAREMLDQARSLKAAVGNRASLIMNDRADLCLAADFDGLHVGQDDLAPSSARAIIGEHRWLGVSTHNAEQLRTADGMPCDYVAIGPIFETRSKEKPDPVIGLEGIRKARELTEKPLVAIGGITRATARSVLAVGADSVAVISDLLSEPRKSAEEFLAILG
jgi:thiamine-phosphate pyrophosphorylase